MEDPTYLDMETIDTFDADIGACTAIFDLSKNTSKSINIIEEKCAPEYWHVLTPSDTQLQPQLTNNTLKTTVLVLPQLGLAIFTKV